MTSLSVTPPSDFVKGNTLAVFTVTRDGDRSGPSTVKYTSSVGAEGMVFFGGGEASKQIWLTLTGEETSVSVSLNSPTGATLTVAKAGTPVVVPVVTTAPVANTGVLFSCDFHAPISLYHRVQNPKGRWKTNCYFDKDGEIHDWMNNWSDWGDTAGSRSGGDDLQIYSDIRFNGVNPFVSGTDGLKIVAAPHAVDSVTTKPFTGGVITTEMSFYFRYGYVEFTGLKMDPVSGIWPGLWLLGLPHTNYRQDEIDIGEALGGNMKSVYLNAHLPRLGTSLPGTEVPFDWTNGGTLGLLWTPEKLIWYVNRVAVWEVANPADGFHRPMYVMIDNAVGPGGDGGWAVINRPNIPASGGALTVGSVVVYADKPF